MANSVASYDQLAHQVEVLRKENSHLRRELEDNSNHLSKLETETFGMKVSLATPTTPSTLSTESTSHWGTLPHSDQGPSLQLPVNQFLLLVLQEVLKQLQSKLEQEAGTLASSGRSDVLHQLKGLNQLPHRCLSNRREEERERGGKGGKKEGRKEGRKSGREEVKEEGRKEGREEGRREGRKGGR